jgi:hypothetical protein
VIDELGDAADRSRHDRKAAGHRLDEHVWNAIAIAVVAHPARQTEHVSALVLAEQRGLRHRALESYVIEQIACVNAIPDEVRVLARFTDDRQLERYAPRPQFGACVDQHVESFLRHVTSDADDAEHAAGRRADAVGSARHQVGEFRIQSVIHREDRRRSRKPQQIRAIRFGAGDRELCGGKLSFQEARRVQRR